MRLLISRFRKLLDFANVAAESRELNTKLINPKECLDFLGRRCYRRAEMEGGHEEESGKAFRSLSAPPSRMPLRTYMWLLNPTMYIYTNIHTRSRKFFFADARVRKCTFTRHVYQIYAHEWLETALTSYLKPLLEAIKRCVQIFI